MPSIDTCLNSQEIRDLIDRGTLQIQDYSEDRIQPSSFEPTIGEELFILDTEGGVLRPQYDQTVYRTLLELPRRRRQKIDITGGFETKRGYSYLIPLQEKITDDENIKFILSSPKSSTGRTFPNTRLLADYNASFDEIQRIPHPINLWLLFQPLAFSFLIKPGLSFNQLRFLTDLMPNFLPKK